MNRVLSDWINPGDVGSSSDFKPVEVTRARMANAHPWISIAYNGCLAILLVLIYLSQRAL